ncbi:calcium-activated chloride channel regulator 1-like [Oratosquilla oratoria]|uniref:calcium-activated chloride channel regulator 1-like n=1 Tax=Oratosquilla oratoria TaxID=337810 RepID=UPI003F76B912
MCSSSSKMFASSKTSSPSSFHPSSRRLVTLVCIFLALTLSGVRSTQVTLRDNGYEGVVIALQNDLPSSQCQQVILALEDILRSASSVVFTATRGRASFRSVKVLVPSIWHCDALSGVASASSESWTSADIRVTSESHPVYGDEPWTLQTRGCAQVGDYVSFGHEILLRNDTLLYGRLLAHAWLRYRYGVFEESGSVGNPLHPPHYRHAHGPSHDYQSRSTAHDAPPLWVPNACSNVPLKEENPEDCDPGSPMCDFSIAPQDNTDVTSSLLAFPYLSSATDLCDEGTHNSEAPTRHNLLCRGQSVWEVMRASPDFQNNRNVEGGLREADLSITFLKPTSPRVVLVIDDTNAMNVQKRWDFMRKAVRKMLTYDVPDGHSVGLVVYDAAASIKYPLTRLFDGITREKVGSSLPRNPSRVGEDRRCVVCGLKEALNLLKGEGTSPAGAHVVLVTAGTGEVSEGEFAEASRLLKKNEVRLQSIVYPMTDRFPRPGGAGLERLSAITGGRTYTVPDEGIGADSKLAMYYNLLDAFYHVLTETAPGSLPVKVHSEEHPGGLLQVSQGSFMVDSSLGPDTTFAIFYYDVTHVGNLIHLENPNGQVIDTANMQKEDANINMITVHLNDAQVQPGLWRYKVENRADSHQALFVQVTSRPRHGDARMNVRAWTSHPKGEVNATDISRPLALYAEVRRGIAPMEGVTVTAKITKLGFTQNGTSHSPIAIRLYDNGLTSPDIAATDGVHSRYVPNLGVGKYSIAMHVEGLVGETRFLRHLRVGLVDVVGSGATSDVIPPARIVDLRASLLPDSTNRVMFTWTSPGGDLDFGSADRYEVIWSDHAQDLLSEEGRAFQLEDWTVPQRAGSSQSHTVVWDTYDTVSYVGMYAVDEVGNTAPMSNLVLIYVPSPPTTLPPAVPTPSPSSPINSSEVHEGPAEPVLASLDTRQLALLFGCIGGFLLFVIIIVCYCTAVHRRQRKTAAAKKAQEAQDNYSVTVTVASKGTDFPNPNDDVKTKKEYISPMESWSASQLLSSHDRRYSVSGRSDNNSDHTTASKKSYGSSDPNDYYNDANQYQYRTAGYPEPYHRDGGYPPSGDGYPATPTELYPAPGVEARSYMSSQPSDSFLSVSCDMLPSHGPPAYPANHYPSYDSSLRSPKVPPPIPPKPKVHYSPQPMTVYEGRADSQSSTPSVSSSEKRVRNVTMV